MGGACPSASIVTTISASSCSAISYPTRRASPPPRRIGSSVTSAPASRARRAVGVVAPVAHDDGDHLHALQLTGIARTTSPTLSCSLICRQDHDDAPPFGEAAARSQSNRSLPKRLDQQPEPRSFVSDPDWSRSTRKNRSEDADHQDEDHSRRSAPGTMSNQLNTGSYDGRSERQDDERRPQEGRDDQVRAG